MSSTSARAQLLRVRGRRRDDDHEFAARFEPAGVRRERRAAARGGCPHAVLSARGRPRPRARPSPRRDRRAYRQCASRPRTAPASHRCARAPSMRARRAPSFGGRNPSKKKRSVGRPATVSAASTADAPGIGVIAWPAPATSRTSLKPGSEISGVPASDTSAIAAPSRQPLQQLRPGGLRVVLVIGRQRRRNQKPVEQLARNSGVLAGDQVAAGERLERAQGDVAEVPDRRRDQIKPGRGTGHGDGALSDSERARPFVWQTQEPALSGFADVGLACMRVNLATRAAHVMALHRTSSPMRAEAARQVRRHNASGLVNHWTTICPN